MASNRIMSDKVVLAVGSLNRDALSCRTVQKNHISFSHIKFFNKTSLMQQSHFILLFFIGERINMKKEKEKNHE